MRINYKLPMLGDSSDTETKDTIVKQYRRRGRRGTCVDVAIQKSGVTLESLTV